MKKQILSIVAIVAVALSITACKGEKKAEVKAAEKVEQVVSENKYRAIPSESMIHWKANKLVGGHSGTIGVSNGVLKTKGNAIVGGNFIFNIASLKVTDLPTTDKNNAKLVGHLLAPDFFESAKYPNAVFQITKVVGNNVSGNLTMKGIKKNITFPVKMNVTGNEVMLNSDTFTIDRTEWNIKYNSGKFADAAKLGDYLIKDDIELKIMIKAQKI